MPKDNIHYGGWEHRDVHNLNGMLFVRILFFAKNSHRFSFLILDSFNRQIKRTKLLQHEQTHQCVLLC